MLQTLGPHIACPISHDVKLWRYMDFTKYVSLLVTGSLYFARMDKLGDPFEGTYPRENHDRFEHAAMAEVEGMVAASEGEKQERYRISSGLGKWISKELARSAYVNCWHCSNHESAAMWKLYLKSDEGIAIQSSTKGLAESMKEADDAIFIGKVKYIDFAKEAIENPRGVLNVLDPIFHKRLSFEHEKEIRACIHDVTRLNDVRDDGSSFVNVEKETPPGLSIPVDLNTLIEVVYLSPTTVDWFYELVKSVSSGYSVNAKVHRSSLSSSPII
jgi:hypothetical protein